MKREITLMSFQKFDSGTKPLFLGKYKFVILADAISTLLLEFDRTSRIQQYFDMQKIENTSIHFILIREW
jgi:hypothetical protein